MALAVSRLSRRAVPFSRNYRYVVRAYNSWRVGDDSLKKKLRTGIGILTAGSLIFILTQKYSRVNVVHALKSRKRDDDMQKAVKLTMRERRFIKFASVEYDGQLYMTPQDFLDSVVESEPRPRLKRRVLSDKELEVMGNAIPSLRHGSPHMFRSLRDKGIISYTEYLFLLSILTKPKTGFHIAFNMFDTDGNERVDKTEFLVIRRLFDGTLKGRNDLDETTKRAMEKVFSHAWRGRHGGETKDELEHLNQRQESPEEIQGQYINDDQGLQRRHAVDTTLMIHFFGKDGNHELKYEDFRRFMENLQHEVLELEFHEYSKGHDTINELDFAKILLRYTELDVDEFDKYLERMIDRSDLQIGITFDEFRRFYQFLNNLDDFSIAMQMYTLADHPISKDEFQRAVKICTGSVLSSHIIDTVFALFDEDGDGQLSYKEFIAIMKDRLKRGFKSQQRNEGREAFKYCVKQEMKAP
ncbi:calcium uptake protein 3, mitochondrial-like isoform X3 [Vespa mandarinia]|uniref:calcium uptake protein 3, mitochondrial-like isoform X3 n=1 Tax=Vespa mandarinia TaxID=7446 RepID=UPI00161757A5|nr:calcium uptake protein 3, mitochondrial-like isoform X3 [Vespa mandarinia]XP_046834263.1 calcium uptake protein 3, mitochondrial isoform X3 [Vespa crabro]XP_047369180.1 calcium uptake protein 3, mitochondrial isoform X3 [Vespa velutina]